MSTEDDKDKINILDKQLSESVQKLATVVVQKIAGRDFANGQCVVAGLQKNFPTCCGFLGPIEARRIYYAEWDKLFAAGFEAARAKREAKRNGN